MNIFLFLIFLLFFVLNPFQQKIAKGMKSSKGKEIVGSTSHNIPSFHAPPQKVFISKFPEIKFSLFELSVFIRILIKIDAEIIINNYNLGILEIIKEYKIVLVNELKTEAKRKIENNLESDLEKKQEELKIIEDIYYKLEKSKSLKNLFGKLEEVNKYIFKNNFLVERIYFKLLFSWKTKISLGKF
uniref:Uncharacterized protein n=1 Tax=Meloidogyne enterolobii TaxID=390850 RepID=A0A6V7V2T8_MELEN|nr:unnamed protein product [Meloidogyne enterolobii]